MHEVLDLSARQQTCAIILALALLVLVVDLVRRRQMGEEFSWLWILASAAIVFVVAWPSALKFITHMTGAVEPSTAVFLLGILFLIVANMYLCTRLTAANRQIKRLAQKVALLDARTPSDGKPSGEPEPDQTMPQ